MQLSRFQLRTLMIALAFALPAAIAIDRTVGPYRLRRQAETHGLLEFVRQTIMVMEGCPPDPADRDEGARLRGVMNDRRDYLSRWALFHKTLAQRSRRARQARRGCSAFYPLSPRDEQRISAAMRDAAARAYLQEADWLEKQASDWRDPRVKKWFPSLAAFMRREADRFAAAR